MKVSSGLEGRKHKSLRKALNGWALWNLVLVYTSPLRAEELAAEFSYHAPSGQCKNPKGQLGLNQASPGTIAAMIKKKLIASGSQTVVYKGVQLECYDLKSLDFSKIVGTSYPSLEGFNFKGASLVDAKLRFVNLIGGQFEGSQLKNMVIGYTTLNGSADRFTTIPAEGCKVLGTSLECRK